MNRLSDPKNLNAPITSEEMDASWRAIEARLDAPRKERLPRRAMAALAVAACFVLVSAAMFRAYATRSVPVAVQLAGPLHVRGVADAVAVLRASSTGAPIELDDGSQLRLHGTVSLAVLENDASRFSLQQSKGSASYEVTPGGPRRWSIETALGTVEVVGTGFDVDASDDALVVTVRHGIVLVRGERVPSRVQRLTAGESITVRAPHEAPVVSIDSLPSVVAPVAAAPSAAAAPNAASRPKPSDPARWRDLASSGSYRDAFDALGSGGMVAASAAAPVEDLFVLADVARLSGHPAEAVTPLRRILRDHVKDARAPLAAFTLGRVLLDSLGEPRAAAEAFERALSLGIGDGLREDAHLRRIAALDRTGDAASTSRAARDYLAQYPNGEAKVRKWLAP